MRRILGEAVFVLALLPVLPLHAQDDTFRLTFGVKGGVDIISMDFSGEALKSNNRTGFFIGPVLKFRTPVAGLNIDLSALYDQRHLKVGGKSVCQQTLLIPAHVRLGVDVASLMGIFITAGPQMGLNVGEDTFQWRDVEDNPKQYILQQTTLSLNLGGGVTIGKSLEAGVYYNIPLGKTGDFSWASLEGQLSQQTMHLAKSKADAWRLAVSYYF